MKRYYIRTDNSNGFEEVSEFMYLTLKSNKQNRAYADKLYRGEILLQDIPEDRRDSIQSIVSERIEKYGSYGAQPSDASEVLALAESVLNKSLTRDEAIQLFKDLLAIRDSATDAVASMTAGVFPELKGDGQLIKAKTRINWNGVVKRARVDLWDTAANTPDNAPTLWEDINYKNGYRVIPSTITATETFGLGECGWWGEDLYISQLETNVWTPDQYSEGWILTEI